jgi:hypothetical protein
MLELFYFCQKALLLQINDFNTGLAYSAGTTFLFSISVVEFAAAFVITAATDSVVLGSQF